MKGQTNTYLILVILLTTFSVGSYTYFNWHISKLTNKIVEVKSSVENKQIKLRYIELVNSSAEKTVEERKRISDYFIKSDGSVSFVSYVEHVALSLGLKNSTNSIESIQVGTLIEQNRELLRINMTLSGDWLSLAKFIAFIESLPYSVKIDRIDLLNGTTTTPVSTQDEVKTLKKPINKGTGWNMSVTFSVVKIK